MVDLLNKTYASGGSVVVATKEHVEHIAKNLRSADLTEINLLGSQSDEGMARGLSYDDESYTVLTKDKTPCAMFGVGAVEADEGYIWMLGTDEIFDYKADFIRFSRPWIKKITTKYPKYSNMVHSQNHFSLRWLLWCGATLVHPVDVNGATFYKFTIYNNYV
tara:strand:+ start:22633 stop:23118 length:486 start_codon:yes stop_codon:yes gene_type:complete